jgi:hypothetical protein
MKSLIPIKENENKGFHYSVTPEQISAHQKRSLLDIFEWLETTSKFIYSLQTAEERKRSIENKS